MAAVGTSLHISRTESIGVFLDQGCLSDAKLVQIGAYTVEIMVRNERFRSIRHEYSRCGHVISHLAPKINIILSHRGCEL